MQATNQAYSTTTTILFDDGSSWVHRGFPEKNDADSCPKDAMGRTEADRRFLNQFESILLAADKGSRGECQKIIEEGYYDFEAYSVGRFKAGFEHLNNVSPIRIAMLRGYFHILELFNKTVDERTAELEGFKKEEETAKGNILQAQMLEHRIKTADLRASIKNVNIQYECVNTRSEMSPIFDLQARDGDNHVQARLYQNTNGSLKDKTISI